MRKVLILILPLLVFAACDDSPVFPETPAIEFISITPDEVPQLTTDGLTLKFRYQDGDGDLGYEGTDGPANLFVTDLRAQFINNPGRTSAYSIPSLTPDTRKPSIQGEIEIQIFSPLYEPSEEPLIFEVYMVDRAGNVSNVIQTDPVTITP